MPTLCHKLKVPYAIVRDKALLGQFVHIKRCAAVAICNIHNADEGAFKKLLEEVEKQVDYK